MSDKTPQPGWSEITEDPVLKMRMRFARRGDLALVDVRCDPGGGVSVEHFHPLMEERFEVLEGEVTFTADGVDTVAHPGDPVVVVPAGARHTFVNTGGTEAHVMTEVEPADPALQEFLETTAAMAREGKFNRRGFPTSFGALLEAADLADRHRASTVLTGGIAPPPLLQPAAFGALAWLRRRR